MREIDRDALALYLRHNYIPAPYTIYTGFRKLLPGTILTLTGSSQPGELPEPEPYWSARQVVESGVAHPFEGSDQEAVGELDALLRESIRERMIADVPLGAFLSGGIDSSAVVALMQAQSSRPIQTFTIGFHESGYDEARYAKAMWPVIWAPITPNSTLPRRRRRRLSRACQPCSMSHSPTLHKSPLSWSLNLPGGMLPSASPGMAAMNSLAAITVIPGRVKIWKATGWVPGAFRNLGSAALRRIPPAAWDSLLSNQLIPPRWRVSEPGEKMRKIAEILSANSPEAIYLDLVSHWKNPSAVVRGAAEPPTLLTRREAWAQLPDFTSWMMYMDLVTYLPDDILVKLDRASMGISLECRVPYLDDHRVVEFAWRLPLQMKIRKGQGKWLLRQVLYRYVPNGMVERPKKGFGVPIDAWLKGPLRGWAEALAG